MMPTLSDNSGGLIKFNSFIGLCIFIELRLSGGQNWNEYVFEVLVMNDVYI